MTLFEYVSVAVSILLALGMVHILSRIKDVVDRGRIYWVHTAHVGIILVLHPIYWWIFWGFRDVSWNFPLFLLALVGPSLICVMATSVVPRETSAVSSWRIHHFEIHRSLFPLYAVLLLVMSTQGWLHRGVSFLDPSRIPLGLFFIGAIVGTFSGREQVHAAVVIVMIAISVVGAGTFLLAPVTTYVSP